MGCWWCCRTLGERPSRLHVVGFVVSQVSCWRYDHVVVGGGWMKQPFKFDCQLIIKNTWWATRGPRGGTGSFTRSVRPQAMFVGGSCSLPRRAWPLLLFSNGLLNVLSQAAQVHTHTHKPWAGFARVQTYAHIL